VSIMSDETEDRRQIVTILSDDHDRLCEALRSGETDHVR
jgi:hypothetical protein